MRITVTKKGCGHKLGGVYRKEGETFEAGARNARVWTAVGFTETAKASPAPKPATKKKAKKKPVYSTRDMVAADKGARDKDE
jgi:hypothetical protein